jgi:hypothetical protein
MNTKTQTDYPVPPDMQRDYQHITVIIDGIRLLLCEHPDLELTRNMAAGFALWRNGKKVASEHSGPSFSIQNNGVTIVRTRTQCKDTTH